MPLPEEDGMAGLWLWLKKLWLLAEKTMALAKNWVVAGAVAVAKKTVALAETGLW